MFRSAASRHYIICYFPTTECLVTFYSLHIHRRAVITLNAGLTHKTSICQQNRARIYSCTLLFIFSCYFFLLSIIRLSAAVFLLTSTFLAFIHQVSQETLFPEPTLSGYYKKHVPPLLMVLVPFPFYFPYLIISDHIQYDMYLYRIHVTSRHASLLYRNSRRNSKNDGVHGDYYY